MNLISFGKDKYYSIKQTNTLICYYLYIFNMLERDAVWHKILPGEAEF